MLYVSFIYIMLFLYRLYKNKYFHTKYCVIYFSQLRYLGGYSVGDPPLPIPNREVKPNSADGTAIKWESRQLPFLKLSPFNVKLNGLSCVYTKNKMISIVVVQRCVKLGTQNTTYPDFLIRDLVSQRHQFSFFHLPLQ